MNTRHLTDDEIKALAVDVLRCDLGIDVEGRPFKLVQSDDEPGAEVWTIELLHSDDVRIDPKKAIQAQGRLATRIFQAGDPRLFLMRHRFEALTASTT